MPRIKPIDYEDASVEVQKVFDDIEGAFGMVPNLFKTAAHFPPLLKANWEKVKGMMMQGALTRKTKEAIAILVSKDNSCQYCVSAHSAILKSVGIPEDEVKQIEEEVEKADFTGKELALIAFARKANSDPNKVSDSEFDTVRSKGATDSEIVEALGVMEVFTAFNKFIDSLDVEIDF